MAAMAAGLLSAESGGDSSASFEGHLVSTGERHVTDNVSLVGLGRLRELSREERAEGYRVPVRYLPKRGGFRAGVDRINRLRVRAPGDFGHGFPAGLVAVNAVTAPAGILLIRRVVRSYGRVSS